MVIQRNTYYFAVPASRSVMEYKICSDTVVVKVHPGIAYVGSKSRRNLFIQDTLLNITCKMKPNDLHMDRLIRSIWRFTILVGGLSQLYLHLSLGLGL